MAAMVTRCSPIGFGRSWDRVLNTPVSGFRGSSRGWTASTSRRAWCSQVSTKTSAPTARSRMASAISGLNTSHACGAPSNPCLGAAAASIRGDSTCPTGLIS